MWLRPVESASPHERRKTGGRLQDPRGAGDVVETELPLPTLPQLELSGTSYFLFLSQRAYADIIS